MTVYGQKSLPERIVYSGDTGVFLSEYQERLVLEKFQWKEIYKNDAVTLYFVNRLLEERIKNSEEAYNIIMHDRDRLENENIKLINKNSQLSHDNNMLDEKNKKLKKKNNNKTKIIIGESIGIGFLLYLILK